MLFFLLSVLLSREVDMLAGRSASCVFSPLMVSTSSSFDLLGKSSKKFVAACIPTRKSPQKPREGVRVAVVELDHINHKEQENGANGEDNRDDLEK